MTRGYVSALDVAKAAGVSRSAVSRSFTPGASVAPETRARVLKAAEALGYQVNDLARGLLGRSSRLVGLIVTDPTGFRAHLLFALSRLLIARGSVPVIINTGATPQEQAVARQMLFGHRVEASFVLSGTPPPEFIELARRNGQPVVLIGRGETGIDAVQVANSAPSAHLARLFHAAGHRHVGLVSTREPTPMIARRAEAFAAEAGRLGLTLTTFEGEASLYDEGVRVAQGSAATAVYGTNDLLAMGFMDGLRRQGLPLPAVVGFDDLPEAAWAPYDLTTFRQDPEVTARAALALLDRRLADPQRPPERNEIAVELVVRGSFVP